MRWGALLLLLLSASAGAQSFANCSKDTGMESFELCPDQGLAVTQAGAVADMIIARGDSGYGPGRLSKGATSIDAAGRSVTILLTAPGGGGVGRVGRMWPLDAGCNKRGSLGPGVVKGADGTGACYNGCFYSSSSGNGDVNRSQNAINFGGINFGSTAGWGPTGVACSDPAIPTPSEKEQCVSDGTLTQCLRPDGKHCASASNGTMFCWGQGESGIKKAPNGNEAATKSPFGIPINAPKDPPKNGGDWTVKGQGTTTITNTSTSTSTTNNITNYESNYGPVGSGTGTGAGGEGSGDGGGDDGGGEDDEGNEPGGPGDGPGELYGGTDLSLSGMVAEYYGKVSNTPVLRSVRSFMMVQGGGACPVFALPANNWIPALSFDAHCSGTFYAVLLTMGYVLLGTVCYFAIRISVT